MQREYDGDLMGREVVVGKPLKTNFSLFHCSWVNNISGWVNIEEMSGC